MAERPTDPNTADVLHRIRELFRIFACTGPSDYYRGTPRKNPMFDGEVRTYLYAGTHRLRFAWRLDRTINQIHTFELVNDSTRETLAP